MTQQDLLPKKVREAFASYPLYSQDDDDDPQVVLRLFSPYSSFTFLFTEYDGDDTFFGWVRSHLTYGEWEAGYSSLRELKGVRLTLWGTEIPAIERDLHFSPCPLSQAKEK